MPPALAGNYLVSATSIGGTGTAAARLAYVVPRAADSASYTKTAATVTASGVLWVSGGPDATDVLSTGADPWTVAVAAGGAIPDVGDSYLLAPGGGVFPTGLTGTVTSIAAQQDGSTRLLIAPASLDNSLAAANVQYSDGPSTGARHADADADASAEVSYPDLEPQEFACTTGGGEITDMTGSIGLKFEDLHRVFSFSAGVHPSVTAYVTGTIVSYGTVTVDARSVTCSLKPSWVDANRKILPLGDGGTLSFGPAAEIKISASGTVTFEHRTQFMYGLSKTGSGGVQYYRMAKQQGVTSSVSAALSVEVSLGVSVQFGLLDRVGIEIKPELFAEGSASITSQQACIELTLGVQVSVGAFLDVWVKRWEYSPLTFKVGFPVYTHCGREAVMPAPDGAPQITSDVLNEAQAGVAYSDQLVTQDGRPGNWSLASGALPDGLDLSPDGSLSGTPSTSAIGTDRFGVRFLDESGRSDYANVLMEVDPDDGLGGGDIQATLTWNSTADLDLHGSEPDGYEIYYDQPGPTDSDGELDHDANAGCNSVDASPTENIHWPSSDATSGEYDFSVVTWSDCNDDDLNWHLVVRVRGVVVIDENGYGDSDWYSLQYSSATGAEQVTRHVRAAGVERPAPTHGGAK